MSKFNEATRVQMPAMVHLTRLGYKYFGKISEEDAGTVYDPSTNILLEVFESQFDRLNPESSVSAKQMIQDIRNDLKNDDLGRALLHMDIYSDLFSFPFFSFSFFAIVNRAAVA